MAKSKSAKTKKDKKQYEHIKQSYKGNPRAKEIAARTVNKMRSQRGDTKNGKKERSDLNDKRKKELYEEAKKLDVHGRSQMNKKDLIQAIQKAA